jgi:hypothetical protein
MAEAMPSDVGVLIAFLILVVAGGVEIYIRFGPVRRREILSWLNWTLAFGIAYAMLLTEQGLLQNVLTGLVFGGLGQPAVRWAAYLRYDWGDRFQADWARKLELTEKQRSYHPTAADFGGPPPAKPPTLAPRPNTTGASPRPETGPPPINLPLLEATTERRPGWARGLEIAAVVIVMFVGAALFLFVSMPQRRDRVDPAAAQEVLLATLELAGHEIPRVRRIRMASPCPIGQIGYRWTALDGRGRACVDSNLAVDITVDEQWPARR